jgi:plastocyanin
MLHTSLLRLVSLTVAAALVSGCGDDSVADPDGDPMTATVFMPGFTFTPPEVTIAVGGTVSFDFPNEPHNVIFARVTGAPSDIQQTRNAIVTRQFTVAGTFPYDCRLHPGMDGVVVAR